MMMTNVNFRLIPLLTVFLLSACGEPKEPAGMEAPYFQAAEILTFEPQPSYVITRTFIGEINAKQQTKLSFEYGGTVEKILVDTSDNVESGQILATLNTELIEIKKQEIVAKIKQTNAQLVLNEANLNRIKDLQSKGYGSEQSVDELTAEKAILLATIEQLNASMNNINYQMSKSVIAAPYQGTVHKRLISQGDMIAGGQPSFSISSAEEHQINVGIPADIADNLTIKQQLHVEVNNKNLTATVVAIGQHINSFNRTVQVRLILNQNDGLEIVNNLDGEIARVKIDEEIIQSGFWLPLSAITDGIRGQWNILLAKPLNENNDELFKLESATVIITHSDNNYAFVTNLPEQQLSIVISGIHRYVPKQTVRKIQTIEQGK